MITTAIYVVVAVVVLAFFFIWGGINALKHPERWVAYLAKFKINLNDLSFGNPQGIVDAIRGSSANITNILELVLKAREELSKLGVLKNSLDVTTKTVVEEVQENLSKITDSLHSNAKSAKANAQVAESVAAPGSTTEPPKV